MTIKISMTSRSRKNNYTALKADRIFKIGLRKALFDIGLDATRESIDIINNSGRTGRIYNIRGNPHTASAPGEAPANRTGRLKKSMNYRVRDISEVEWGSLIPYGEFLEKGTRRMAKRPFLTPIFESRGSHHAQLLLKWVQDEIKRHRK